MNVPAGPAASRGPLRFDTEEGLRAFRAARVLCVGDVMLDHFVYGAVDRISPEAPIPVLRVERETRTLGGAGNVLRNLRALGAQAALVSVVGDDEAGRQILGRLEEGESGLLVDPGRTTTLKTRYVAAQQQVLRADRERAAPLAAATRAALVEAVRARLAECDVVVLSDYAKGVLADGVAAELIALARAAGRPAIVDPKGADYEAYRGAAILKPNRAELAAASRLPVGTVEEVTAAARSLAARHGLGAVLVSLSQDGMLLIEKDGATASFAAEAREVFDVSGAGDTVVATLAAALASGAALPEAARLANVAAGIVVGKVGTAVTYVEELAAALAESHGRGESKALPLPLALDRLAAWRRRGFRIGFTNGCFDLLHPGHVSLLAEARAACDRLVVGLNSDASVKRLKGEARPVQNEAARAAVLSSLASVDLVVIFDEETPIGLIEAIRPDVLVKGADYALDQVVGADLVRSRGGEVRLAALVQGHSTTATIRRMGSG
jgi:D-beta-D-heptose 7-phosphate kinase/D-beta-D-heptose 1-phosphate adenosyltransferase